MAKSQELFSQCEANLARRQRGELPATQIWLWGQGQSPSLVPFVEKYGVRGAVITAVDLLRGMGKILGWDVVNVAGATGYLDTDYAAKGRAAIEALKQGNHELIVVHVEATDEASHEGDARAKVEALEQIDRHIVGPVHDYLKTLGKYRILICPDHPTFLRTKTHSHGDVPFAMCGTGISPSGATSYDEATARQSGQRVERGHELMSRLIQRLSDRPPAGIEPERGTGHQPTGWSP
jgi:2,3-bisphosphoglycerate-independent phosphoglycerate mutase